MKRLNQVPAANWDLALPNGQYTVRLVMGDPSFQDQTNHIKIEGVTYTDTDPHDDDQAVDAFGDFDEVTRTVTITDGKLTLSPSSGCYNTKLMFIEVTPLSGGGGTATPGLAAATYKYDALGRRLQKSTGGVTTTFVHDGDQVVAEYEGAALKRRYIYGTYIDEPLAMVTSTGTLYYHQSRIYSVMAMTNSSGQLAERYGYTPYGKRRVVHPGGTTLTASAVGNQVGFTGRYHDGETQLTYFRARYQDAELGRFVGRDPLFMPPLNRYAYVDSSPSNWMDPSGFVKGGFKCTYNWEKGEFEKCEFWNPPETPRQLIDENGMPRMPTRPEPPERPRYETPRDPNKLEHLKKQFEDRLKKLAQDLIPRWWPESLGGKPKRKIPDPPAAPPPADPPPAVDPPAEDPPTDPPAGDPPAGDPPCPP